MERNVINKKILITSTDLMMIQFLIPHVLHFYELGYQVEIVCSNVGERIEEIKGILEEKVPLHLVSLVRNPFTLLNIKGYRELKQLINSGEYDLIWTNEPVMGAASRLAAKQTRKNGCVVVYMTHGFHFYKGSAKSSWIMYYLVEKLMSYLTDLIITINYEDLNLAKKKMKAGRYERIPGIGLDTQKFQNIEVDVAQKRQEIGVPSDSIMMFSVGELGTRKNHEVAIRALGKLKREDVYYIICGKGKLEEYLKNLCVKLGINKRVLFLGYRHDIGELCKCSDIYVFPSRREGLGIAALEGMSVGLPLIASHINGIVDYTEDGKTGYCCHPFDVDGFAAAMEKLISNPELRTSMGNHNLEVVKEYDIENLKKTVSDILIPYLNK